MKKIKCTLFALFISLHLLLAQAPPKQWDVRFGGNDNDILYSLQQTTDGGYILGGYSQSGISGDKSQASQGGRDYWIVKVNSIGVKQWDARFGGSGEDYFRTVQQTTDGGYILGGYSDSGISGDKSQGSQGLNDFWIVKINSIGVKEWDARFGGNQSEALSSVLQTSDGGYILGGDSYSGISGDKSQGSQGSNDFWIVKVNNIGVKQWDARFGGIGQDNSNSIQLTSDGGYIIGGSSNSVSSGDKTQGTQGGNDYWIVKVNSSGEKQWDARFGGNSEDVLNSIQQTSDGGYILGGSSNSNISGDKTQGTQGGNDYWIVKVNSSGVKQWDVRFGGSNDDFLRTMKQTSDGGTILGGYSYSGITGDKSQLSQGSSDYWIVKINNNGVKEWEERFGGNFTELLHSISQSSDGGYILGGQSTSGISGDKTQSSQGMDDFWIVKLFGIQTNTITGSPFCAGSNVQVFYTASTFNNGNIFTAQLSDASGSFAAPTVIGTLASTTSGIINATIPSGTTSGSGYRIRVISSDPAMTGSDNGTNISIQPFTNNVFIETMGTSVSSISVASHESANGFDYDNLTMIGTNATVSNTSPSTGYTGASGQGNVLVDLGTTSFFQIADINTLNSTNLQLSFAVLRTINNNASFVAVEVSSDGLNYSTLTFTAVPNGGAGTNIWFFLTASGTIPQTANLRIRFRQLGTTTPFRIDDVKLTQTDLIAGITASGTTVLCSPATVTLNASNAQNYLWSNNAVTQSILTSTAGNYYCSMTSLNGCILVSNTIAVTSITPTPFNVTGGGIYCSSGPPVSVGLSGSQSGVNYQLKLNNADTGSPVSGTGNAISLGNQTGIGTYTVVATNISQNCTNTMNGNAVISLPVLITNSINGSPFCSGSSVNIPYSISCTLNNGNIFTAQLSDASGSFAAPIAIGTLASPTSGTINAIIPSGTSTGTAYRIRVISSDPAIIGSDNGTNISIQPFTNTNFLETLGTSVSSVSVATYESSNGFDNDNLSMSGTNATVSNINPSTGYTGASGLANVLVDLGTTSFFQIADINTLNSTNLQLSFGVCRTININGNFLVVEVSSDGVNYSALTFTAIPSGGSSTNVWFLRTASGVIPQTANLRIRFRQSSSSIPFRIDDVKLTQTDLSPVVTASGSTTFCFGGNVTLTAINGVSYSWSNGATTQDITTGSPGNYTVSVIGNSGCTLNSSPVTAIVNPLPTATISASGSTTFCTGGSVTLTASSNTNYLWSNGATTQSITTGIAGNYSVRVTDNSGCSATSSAVTVIVNPLPTAFISASGSTSFCPGGNVTLTASANTSYLWNTGAITQSITTGIAGNYSVTVSNANGCSATSAVSTVTVLGNPLSIPTKQWDARFGGSGPDQLNSLQQTIDGGYILGGNSFSGISGDKTQASQGANDYWIVKVNSSGAKEWDARFGGGSQDLLYSLQQTSDGGYILGGSTQSIISGDITQSSQGGDDYWIVKVNSSGVKEWDARFGGSSHDNLTSLIQTSDGGYILGGSSLSGISGDKTQATQGGDDYWIVKVNSNGVKQWDARFGGSGNDNLKSLIQTSDGGYILGGISQSGISGDKTQTSRGQSDYWIVKVNNNGVKEWDARFGGNLDEGLYSLRQTIDRGYILGGYSRSGISGDKTQTSQGSYDYWIVKVNSSGVKQWDARFGGSLDDYINSLQQTSDGGYILGGSSNSVISGDKTQLSQGRLDFWVVKVNSNGMKEWDINLGGSLDEYCSSLQQTNDGGYILGGSSYSGISGDITQETRSDDVDYADYWIVKLKNIPSITPGGPTTFCSGGSVTLAASAGNNYLWSNSETTQSISVNASGSYSVTVDNCYTSNAFIVSVQNCQVQLQLNLFLEGFYTGGGLMDNSGAGGCLFVNNISGNITDADTVFVSAMNAASPHEEVDRQIGILKTNGDVTVTFGAAVVLNNNYFLKINHRNSIETWSANPVQLTASTYYSFSASVTQAYGSNEKLTFDNLYAAIYSGDINQDCAVDGSDFLDFDGPAQVGAGGYDVADLNGDGAVDGSDFLVFDPNSQNGVGCTSIP